jgi:hypothetical protein
MMPRGGPVVARTGTRSTKMFRSSICRCIQAVDATALNAAILRSAGQNHVLT